MIHDEMFKPMSKEEVVDLIKEQQYAMYYCNMRKYPTIEELEYSTSIHEKYKDMTPDEAFQLYKIAYKY